MNKLKIVMISIQVKNLYDKKLAISPLLELSAGPINEEMTATTVLVIEE